MHPIQFGPPRPEMRASCHPVACSLPCARRDTLNVRTRPWSRPAGECPGLLGYPHIFPVCVLDVTATCGPGTHHSFSRGEHEKVRTILHAGMRVPVHAVAAQSAAFPFLRAILHSWRACECCRYVN